MSVFNLGVVFGPTLLRAVEETLAAILDIKFNNVVIEILIENYDLIFKNKPGKITEYLTSHSNQTPEPVPRTYNSNRSSRNYVASQPVVRVVARSNYTDTVMSSSLQNIPNGLAIYQNSGKSTMKNNPYPIYDTKQHLNQSTPTLNRDINLSARDIVNITREPTYVTSNTNSLNLSPNHQPPSTTANVDHQLNKSHAQHFQFHINNRDKLINRDVGVNHNNSSSMIRSDGIYGKTQRLNPMNYSESNLVHPTSSILDRINSTSSSNESVCSTSSLNNPYSRHHPTLGATTYSEYNTSSSGNKYIRDEKQHKQQQQQQQQISEPFMPKKQQRTKEMSTQRYNSPRDNV